MTKSEQAFRNEIKRNPNDAGQWLGLGNVLFNKGDMGEAETAYRKATELDSKNPCVWQALGTLLNQKGDIDGAEASFRKVIELNPEWACTWGSLAVIAYNYRGDLVEAESCYRNAIKYDPKLAPAWKSLGVVLTMRGDLEQAESCLRKAIKLNPKSAESWAYLGVVFDYKGGLGAAESCFRKAIELDPRLAEAWNGLGVVFLHYMDDLDEAELCLRKAIELDPTAAVTWSNLGCVVDYRGDPGAAESCFRKAIELDPRLAAARNGLGFIFLRKNNLDQAELCFSKAIELNSKGSMPWIGRAAIEQVRGGGAPMIAFIRRFLFQEITYGHGDIFIRYEMFLGQASQPLFVLAATTAHSYLLLRSKWAHAREEAELACAKPLECLQRIDIREDTSFRDLLLTGLICHRFGDVWGAYQVFNRINTRHKYNLLGQYYLLEFIDSLAMDTDAAREEALCCARAVIGENSLPEDLYAAGLIYYFCDDLDSAIRCWRQAGYFLPALYRLMLSLHEKKDEKGRDEFVAKILDIENDLYKSGNTNMLKGPLKFEDVSLEQEGWHDQVLVVLRYDEIGYAVETLHHLLDENPQNPVWVRFSEEPVSLLEYGPCNILDICSLGAHQRQQYRDFFIKKVEFTEELRKKLLGVSPFFHQITTLDIQALVNTLPNYLRNKTDNHKVKQCILAYLYQIGKLGAADTLCALLYVEQYHNMLLNKKRFIIYLSTFTSAFGSAIMASLLSAPLPWMVAGGALLGPLMGDLMQSPMFRTRYEDFNVFKEKMYNALKEGEGVTH